MPNKGMSRFSIENLLSRSTEKHRRGNPLCFTKFLESKNFMDKRGGGGGGGSIKIFRRLSFVSQRRKFCKGIL